MRTVIFLCCLVAFASSARAEEEVSGEALPRNQLADTPSEVEFIAFVAIGDRERRAGRIPEAAIAYSRAMKLRRDPVILGRLGVVLVKLQQYAHAANLLDEALQLAETTHREREEFFRAHEVARQHGAWVDVTISHAGASVTLDGKEEYAESISAFTMFLLVGKHEIRASLEGYADVSAVFNVEATQYRSITLTFEKPRLSQLPAFPMPSDPKRIEAPMLPSSNIVGDPKYSPKEDPFYVSPDAKKAKDADETRPSRGSVFAGPVVVFGVASWMPAVGAVVGGAWKPNQYLSLGLEGRAAWLTVGIAGKPISAMTAGGLVSACGHVKWFFGCALGHAGVVRIEPADGTFIANSLSFAKVGGGGRLGARVSLSRSFSLAGTVDALVLDSGIRVGLDGKVLVDQPPIMLGTQVAAQWDY